MSLTVATGEPLAACRGVSVRVGRGAASVLALADVDLEVARDEALTLWGRSGSGKTTLLHVLGGLVAPTRGEVEWEGHPLSTLERRARGARRGADIAYVFQNPSLLPYFTAVENVAFASRVATGAGGGPEPRERLELVGLADKADHLPAELSGGEAQRVALARALAQRPRLLLCDEPTGQLDSDTAERVLDLIEALRREVGFALVIATHNADVAARLDREVALLDGRVVPMERGG